MAKRKGLKTAHISFVLDRSGSMLAVKTPTIEGFNEFLKAQQAEPGESRWTLWLFDTIAIEALYENAPPEDIPLLDHKSYQPRGGTPLWDAVAIAIESARKQLGFGTYTVVVQTDGFENSSQRPIEEVRGLIAEAEKDGWQFIFLGADQDAWDATQHLGFRNAFSVSYDNTTIDSAFAAASSYTSSYRSTGVAAAAVQDLRTDKKKDSPEE